MNYISRYVYFMKPVGLPGPIKIGCSTKPVRRLLTLSVWSPFPLEIVAVTRGDLGTEKVLHDRFAALRSHGEWFRPEPELLAFIATVPVALDEPREKPSVPLGRRPIIRLVANARESMSFGLTKRQRDVFEFIERFIAENRHSPTYAEIAQGIGAKSKSTVHGIIHGLQRRGLINLKAGGRQSVSITASREAA